MREVNIGDSVVAFDSWAWARIGHDVGDNKVFFRRAQVIEIHGETASTGPNGPTLDLRFNVRPEVISRGHFVDQVHSWEPSVAVRRRFHRLRQLRAAFGGYFWLPCSRCHTWFGGFECGFRGWPNDNYRTTTGTNQLGGARMTTLCVSCSLQMKQDDPAWQVESVYGTPDTFLVQRPRSSDGQVAREDG